MTNSEKLTQTIETAKTNYATADGSGSPWRKSFRVINDHMVQVNIFGWDTESAPVVWVNKSSEPLTVTEALARIS